MVAKVDHVVRKVPLDEIEIKSSTTPLPSRPSTKNRMLLFRKAVYFVLSEGVRRTYRKILSKKIQKSIESIQVLGFDKQYRPFISYDHYNAYILEYSIDSTKPVNPFEYGRYIGIQHKPPCNNYEKLNLTRPTFVFGFGDYVRVYLLPRLRKMNRLVLVDYNDALLKTARDKFQVCLNTLDEALPLWSKADQPVAFIASYHSDHAWMVSRLASANQSGSIFVEKPPCVLLDELEIYRKSLASDQLIEIGFNRRYSPVINYVKRFIRQDEPMLITCNVNEVPISDFHWYLWRNQGTRFTGNGCHWVDLGCHLIKANPIQIDVVTSGMMCENVSTSVRFEDGSILTLVLTDQGNNLRGVQEHIVIKQNNMTCIIDDFMMVNIYNQSGKRIRKMFYSRDKGHDRMYKSFIRKALLGQKKSDYPLHDLERVVAITREVSDRIERELIIDEAGAAKQ